MSKTSQITQNSDNRFEYSNITWNETKTIDKGISVFIVKGFFIFLFSFEDYGGLWKTGRRRNETYGWGLIWKEEE